MFTLIRNVMGFDFREEQELFLFSEMSMSTLEHPAWVTGVFSRNKGGQGVKLTTHLHLVPTLRTSLHPTP